MRLEHCIRRWLGLSCHYVERVEEGEGRVVAEIEAVAGRLARCGHCGQPVRRTKGETGGNRGQSPISTPRFHPVWGYRVWSSFAGDPPAMCMDAGPGSTHAPALAVPRVGRGVRLDAAHGLAIVDPPAALGALVERKVGHAIGPVAELTGPVLANALDPSAPAGWATLDFQHRSASYYSALLAETRK